MTTSFRVTISPAEGQPIIGEGEWLGDAIHNALVAATDGSTENTLILIATIGEAADDMICNETGDATYHDMCASESFDVHIEEVQLNRQSPFPGHCIVRGES